MFTKIKAKFDNLDRETVCMSIAMLSVPLSVGFAIYETNEMRKDMSKK